MKKKINKMYRTLFIMFFFLSGYKADARLGIETVFLNVNGIERFYKVCIPENYKEDHHYPVVFILHGGGGDATGMIRFTRGRFNRLADRDGFIAVYPNGYKRGWNDGERDTLAVARRLNIDDVGFFDAMIDDLDEKLLIDRRCIFACGISNGGFMVQRLAIERSDAFRGIGVVAANMSADQQATVPEYPVPLISICGTADPLVPYHGGPVMVLKQERGVVLSVGESVDYWKGVNGCVGDPTVTTFEDINKQDRCTAVKTVWSNPENERLYVVNIKVENGGHTWPGTKQYLPRELVGNMNRDFNGCDEIWRFFKSVKRN